MRSFHYIRILIVFLGASAGLLHGQDRPIQTKLFGAVQTLLSQERMEDGAGYGAGAQISTRLGGNVRLNLTLNYDIMAVQQPYVLDEWEWDYWETTYIPFLPGANLARINHELTYTSTDSIYSAVFDPTQTMKELSISTGFTWELPLGKKITPYVGLSGGLDLFSRTLHMEEHWVKRFSLDSLSAGAFDYEYKLDVLHFAPAKKGKRLFAMPAVGVRYLLSPSVDIDLAAQYVYYPSRDSIEWLENLFNISSDSQKWFPFKSKALLTLGLTFKY